MKTRPVSSYKHVSIQTRVRPTTAIPRAEKTYDRSRALQVNDLPIMDNSSSRKSASVLKYANSFVSCNDI